MKNTLIISLIILLSLHTFTHTRWPVLLGGILITNWAYLQLQQSQDMQRRSLAAVLERSEKEIEREYPRINFLDTSVELVKEAFITGKNLVVAFSNKKDGSKLTNSLQEAFNPSEESFNESN
jgi:hypothetical protein